MLSGIRMMGQKTHHTSFQPLAHGEIPLGHRFDLNQPTFSLEHAQVNISNAFDFHVIESEIAFDVNNPDSIFKVSRAEI
jgi:hypothetical protein